MLTTRLLGTMAVTAALLLAPGCRSGSAPLASVRGQVTYRGQPLRTGIIVFTPDAGRGCVGELSIADVQPDGTYLLKSGSGTGAAVGWHRVTVCAVLSAAAPLPGQRYAIPLSLLPHKYRDPALSGLACEVKADTPNTIDFQLD